MPQQATEQPSQQTLEQRRARHAWKAVDEVKQKYSTESKEAKEYGSEAKKLPTRILTAGLGQALAFLRAKANPKGSEEKKKAHLLTLETHITKWVMEERGITGKHRDSLLQSIIHGDSDFLRRATDETIAYLQWLTRFAEAEGLTEGAE